METRRRVSLGYDADCEGPQFHVSSLFSSVTTEFKRDKPRPPVPSLEGKRALVIPHSLREGSSPRTARWRAFSASYITDVSRESRGF
jgi:hypothetical protein